MLTSYDKNKTTENNKHSEEKTKPFRLVKYFGFLSLISIFMGTIVLSFVNIHWSRAMQLQKSEEYTQVLVENLNHQIFLQFVLPVYAKYGEIQLRQKAQFERMDTIVRNTLHSFEVDQFNIYDLENTISYSLNPQIIGEKDRGGAA